MATGAELVSFNANATEGVVRVVDELDVPSWLSKPDTGVTIEVPAEYECVYPVAPLAFYLGATLEIGDDPALHLDNGYSAPRARRRRRVVATPQRDASADSLLTAARGRCSSTVLGDRSTG